MVGDGEAWGQMLRGSESGQAQARLAREEETRVVSKGQSATDGGVDRGITGVGVYCL